MCIPLDSWDAEKSGWLIIGWFAIGCAVTKGLAASMEYAAVGGPSVLLLTGIDPKTVIALPVKLNDNHDPTTSVWCDVWKNPWALMDQDDE